MDKDREREGSVLAQLFSEAAGRDRELVRRYFLTMVESSDVVVNGKEDRTHPLITRSQDIPGDHHKFYLARRRLPPMLGRA